MRRVVPHTVALWAVLASPAGAASVSLDRPCATPGQAVQLTATGLQPQLPWSATLGSLALGGGMVDDAGAASATFPAPTREDAFEVAVSDLLGHRAAATLHVSRTTVEIQPVPRHPRTARVRFAVRGLGGGAPPVYLHWVDPRGQLRGTARLGTASGPCGRLTSGRRRLLPFRPLRGRWRLQIDTRQRYARESRPRIVQGVRLVSLEP